jgi:hypothetical protein
MVIWLFDKKIWYAKLLFKFMVLFKINCAINFYSTSYSVRVLTILSSQDSWWLAKPEYIDRWFKVIRCKNSTWYSSYFSLIYFRCNKVFPLIFWSRTYVTSFYHLLSQFHPKGTLFYGHDVYYTLIQFQR